MTTSASDTVAKNVRFFRRLYEWTVADLSERCVRLGAEKLTPAAITNIELRRGSRKREVSVDELLVLAEALMVPPRALLPQVRKSPEDEHWDALGARWAAAAGKMNEPMTDLLSKVAARMDLRVAHALPVDPDGD